MKAVKALEDQYRKTKVSPWRLPSGLEETRRDLLALTQAQRHALAQTAAALKHQEQQAKSRHQFLLRRIDHLTAQLGEILTVLPPPEAKAFGRVNGCI